MIAAQHGQDIWVAYSEAIQNEYTDPREGDTAHAKLKLLKYKNDIKTYLTSFKTLNLQAGSTGEGLQDIINEALPNEIIDVQFYQNPRALRTDEDFLMATYEAGRHVEELQVLKAQKAAKTSAALQGKKEERRPNQIKQPQGEKKPRTTQAPASRSSPWGQPGRWATKEAALVGVPSHEHEEYFKSPESCWHCGQKGHRTYECFAHTTRKGTTLLRAPWKAAGATVQKEGPKKRR